MTNREAEIERWEEAIRIGLTWVPDAHASKPTDALADLLAELRVARQETETLREAMRKAEDMLDPSRGAVLSANARAVLLAALAPRTGDKT